MDLKKFFAAYEKQRTENFLEVFAENFPQSYQDMTEKGHSLATYIRYLLKFPEFVEGNEMAIISLLTSMAQAILDKEEGIKTWHTGYLCRAMPLFALAPMREFLSNWGGKVENDLAIAEHIEVIARCTIKLKNSDATWFWRECIPEWYKPYPLVIKCVYNEIYIANRMTMSYGKPLPKYRGELERQYEGLLRIR